MLVVYYVRVEAHNLLNSDDIKSISRSWVEPKTAVRVGPGCF